MPPVAHWTTRNVPLLGMGPDRILHPVEGLRGKNVLVVGASAGIGRAVARDAIRAGANVLATARRKEALAALVEEAGGGSFATVDLTVPDDCQRLARETATALGTVDLAVFAAGTARLRRMDEIT